MRKGLALSRKGFLVFLVIALFTVAVPVHAETNTYYAPESGQTCFTHAWPSATNYNYFCANGHHPLHTLLVVGGVETVGPYYVANVSSDKIFVNESYWGAGSVTASVDWTGRVVSNPSVVRFQACLRIWVHFYVELSSYLLAKDCFNETTTFRNATATGSISMDSHPHPSHEVTVEISLSNAGDSGVAAALMNSITLSRTPTG